MKPELMISKDVITIDTKTALNGEDVLHLTSAKAIDDRTGQDISSKLLVNMTNVDLGQAGMYDATISILDENGNLQPLREIAIKIVENTADQNAYSQQSQRNMRRHFTEPTQLQQQSKVQQQPQQRSMQGAEQTADNGQQKPRKKKKGCLKKIIYLLLGILAIYLVWTGISYHQTRQEVDDQGSQIAELQRKNDSLGDQLDTANTQIKELRKNYKATKNAVKNYKKDEDGYRQQYVSQMQQVSQSLSSLKQQLDNQTQQSGFLYNVLNGRLDNLQTTVNQMISARSAEQAQNILDNYKWYK
ncbi:hypothetical protein [Ligilactobacillus pobuzihii]|uniref:DUF5011 domain-containing protein n=1 Tax=Ligilactobacillus pobuzihii TaxID=449659 RepID=A0A0R2L2I3_9LACO|nr:hypothetical protein [Ligilactobacillus pobuzihii]KRK11147.1 hypothetical protein FD11_GL000842 [Ligilactobacillus pobuzihii E100301 = KCTC 13174]KRN95907.1 hypothetical protein IV66_GL000931 [Ligilactobacillus pobuzihii]GEN47720.1 hypothetical protein LPO01_05120 [Ligilactobacillus pobuzihii]